MTDYERTTDHAETTAVDPAAPVVPTARPAEPAVASSVRTTERERYVARRPERRHDAAASSPSSSACCRSR